MVVTQTITNDVVQSTEIKVEAAVDTAKLEEEKKQ